MTWVTRKIDLQTEGKYAIVKFLNIHMFHVIKSSIKDMQVLQRGVVQDNFIDERDEDLNEGMKIRSQDEDEETRKKNE